MNALTRVVSFTPLKLHASANADETLLDLARRTGAPLGNSCGGVGVCARCRVTVLSGAGNLSAPTSIEQRFGAARGFRADERMACQAVVMGDVEVTTSYW